MKEIAAQRATQLQKEEEERIKEQKAKARAKLEELNRRATGASAASGEEVGVDSPKWSVKLEDGQQVEEIPAVEAEAVVQSGNSSGGTKRGARNEHGKRDRDRKANGRKAGGDGGKGKVNGTNGQASAILPPPVASAAPLLMTPMPVPEVYGQQANFQRESRHKARPEKKQLVAKSEDGDRSVPMPTVETFPEVVPAADDGWHMDTPLSEVPKSSFASHPAPSGNEVSVSLRKNKNSRNSRSRPRPEASAVLAESIQFGDIVSGLHIPAFHTIVGGEQAVDAGGNPFHVDVGKDSNVNLSGDALTGDEGSAVSTNGDTSSKRMQRKNRGRRGPSRSDRGSQEQRPGEKAHGNDAMVWAPVRSPKAGLGNKGEVPQWNEQKEESSSAQQQARAKRAEMERYTPKPLMKFQESSEQPAVPPPHQPAQGQSSQAAVSSPEVNAVAESKQFSSADSKGVESGTKPGKSHGSWRPRGSGSERVTEGTKDVPVAVFSAGSGQGDSGHGRHRSEHKAAGGQAPSRRNQATPDHGVPPPPVAPSVLPAAAAAAPAPIPASSQVSEREHPADKKLYQPPRPGSAPAHRGQDHRVQHYRGQDNRGQDHRGQDFRGQDFRGQDHRGHGPQGSEQGHGPQGFEQGSDHRVHGPHSRHSNLPSDRAGAGENLGSQQHHRNGSGQHPRSQNAEREQAPSQQVYVTPHSQQKSQVKEPSQPVPRERESQQHQQQQQATRGPSQHSADGGEHGSNHRGPRVERDQAARPSSGPQRGQGHWQQTSGGDGPRSGSSRAERELAVTPQFGRLEVSKQQAPESQRSHQAEQQQSRAAPVAIPSPKGDAGNWEPAVESPAVPRGRDFGPHGGRRGRGGFGGRTGARNVEMENRRDPPSSKQRLVINATGGAVPSQVAS